MGDRGATHVRGPDPAASGDGFGARQLRATCERLVVARSSALELEVTGHIARHYDRLARDTARRAATTIDAEIGRLRSPAADPARLRSARALADRLAVLADPEAG